MNAMEVIEKSGISKAFEEQGCEVIRVDTVDCGYIIEICNFESISEYFEVHCMHDDLISIREGFKECCKRRIKHYEEAIQDLKDLAKAV